MDRFTSESKVSKVPRISKVSPVSEWLMSSLLELSLSFCGYTPSVCRCSVALMFSRWRSARPRLLCASGSGSGRIALGQSTPLLTYLNRYLTTSVLQHHLASDDTLEVSGNDLKNNPPTPSNQ
jgi:hypothetical protein